MIFSCFFAAARKKAVMQTQDYLAFIPLLLYGIGLADLLAEWKRLFDPKSLFVPYILITIMLTETAVFNVFSYLSVVNTMENIGYIDYLWNLISPFLFLVTVNSFTPDKEADTKEYFLSRMPIFMGLLAVFVGTHFLYGGEFSKMGIVRLIFIAFFIAIAYFKKMWMIYLLFLFWLATFILKASAVA
jgi:hypothetical protein